MSEDSVCAVPLRKQGSFAVFRIPKVQTSQHRSMTGLPRKAHAKLSFNMEGVSERVMLGDGY